MPTRDELITRMVLVGSLEIALDGGCGLCDTEKLHLCACCGRCRCYDHDTCTRPQEDGSTVSDHRKLTQQELVDEARTRFGDDVAEWAFVCPGCKDVASMADFKAALAQHPRKNRDGEPTIASDICGQECIGRTLGALDKSDNEEWTGRGCDWAAYGLFRGPWEIVMPDGHSAWGFALAEAGERQ